jgi:hypothetical protein
VVTPLAELGVAGFDPERDLLALDKRASQLRAIRLAGMGTADRVEQPLHGLGRASHRICGRDERLAGGDAPPDLESFVSGQPQTLARLISTKELSDRRDNYGALQRSLDD